MKASFYNILVIMVIMILCSGCVSPVYKTIKIESDPPGIKIHQGGVFIGETPFETKVGAGDNLHCTASYWSFILTANPPVPGYEPMSKTVNPCLITDGSVVFFNMRHLSSDNKNIIPNISPVYEKSKIMGEDSLSNSWAIVIGISKYQYSSKNGLTNLIFADDDANAFVRSLHSLGWNESHIKLLVNEKATQRNILIALESWLSKAGLNDKIIFFWAGHGFPDPEDPEKVYFACYDTDIKIPATGYRMDRVRASLEERKTKNVIILADTCHAGKLITRGDRGLSIVPSIEKMRRNQNIPKGWIFMVAADTDRQALEHTSWKNGVFTHCLVKALSGAADGYESVGHKDGMVTMGELRAYLNTAMPNETQRVLGVAKRPVITTSTGDPDIWNLSLQVTK
jgi:hypothetical protein